MDRPIRPIVTFAVLVTVTTALAPAAAGATPSSPGHPTWAGAVDDPDEARSEARDLSGAVANQGPVDLLGTLLEAEPAGAPAPALDPGTPTSVAPLVAALGEAQALREQALADVDEGAQLRLTAAATEPGSGGDGEAARTAVVRGPSPEVPEALRAAAGDVDQPLMEEAAATLLGAGISTLEALPQEPAAASAATCPGVSGPVVFEGPACLVIVGASGANTYAPPADPAVLVDRGGDDTYTHGAAAGFQDVEVLVDAGGSDTYARSATASGPGASATVVGQGGGYLGVGVLLDAGGPDTYDLSADASAPEPGDPAGGAMVVGQGSGFVGAGVLADLGGGDGVVAEADSDGGIAHVVAQGTGVAGAGALLSLGGDCPTALERCAGDTYRAVADSSTHVLSQTSTFTSNIRGPGVATAQGSGGLGGAGVLADAAGADAYVARGLGGTALAAGQGGAGLGAVGVVPLRLDAAYAQAAGAGALVDAAGDDRLDLEADGRITIALQGDADNKCWTIHTSARSGPTFAWGQGGAGLGAGLHVDASGADDRSLRSSSVTRAVSEARSGVDCPSFGFTNEAHATASNLLGGFAGGQGGAAAGGGALVDLPVPLGARPNPGTLVGAGDGNDLETTLEVEARAIADSPGDDIESADASSGTSLSAGQGGAFGGAGVSVDVAGDDGYQAATSNLAQEVTSSGTASGDRGALGLLRPAIQPVQGQAENGTAALVDLGGTDAYAASEGTQAANDHAWADGRSGVGIDRSP